MEKKGTLASPATAFDRSVLPVPGGPDEQHPFRNPSAELGEFLGMAEELDDLHQLFLGLVHSGHVVEGHLHLALAVDLGRDLPKLMNVSPAPPAAHPPEHEAPDQHEHREGKYPGEQEVPEPVAGNVAAIGDARRVEVLDEIGIVDADGGERLRPCRFPCRSAAGP